MPAHVYLNLPPSNLSVIGLNGILHYRQHTSLAPTVGFSLNPLLAHCLGAGGLQGIPQVNFCNASPRNNPNHLPQWIRSPYPRRFCYAKGKEASG
jgi:hypothetical protein